MDLRLTWLTLIKDSTWLWLDIHNLRLDLDLTQMTRKSWLFFLSFFCAYWDVSCFFLVLCPLPLTRCMQAWVILHKDTILNVGTHYARSQPNTISYWHTFGATHLFFHAHPRWTYFSLRCCVCVSPAVSHRALLCLKGEGAVCVKTSPPRCRMCTSRCVIVHMHVCKFWSLSG